MMGGSINRDTLDAEGEGEGDGGGGGTPPPSVSEGRGGDLVRYSLACNSTNL